MSVSRPNLRIMFGIARLGFDRHRCLLFAYRIVFLRDYTSYRSNNQRNDVQFSFYLTVVVTWSPRLAIFCLCFQITKFKIVSFNYLRCDGTKTLAPTAIRRGHDDDFIRDVSNATTAADWWTEQPAISVSGSHESTVHKQ